jgi:hypothetical protein
MPSSIPRLKPGTLISGPKYLFSVGFNTGILPTFSNAAWVRQMKAL